jgi:hypothetical protein
VSHQPERKEKDCLNCGATVTGRYCQHCGQENIETKQNFWSLSKHFIYDVFHFDGKFFDTVRYLLYRPGFVPKEYVEGRRMSYLDPIRMYLFTSALFFLIFFTVKDINPDTFKSEYHRNMTRQERLDYSSVVYGKLKKDSSDTVLKKQLSFLLDTSFKMKLDSPSYKPSNDSSFLIEINNRRYILVSDSSKVKNKINIGSTWVKKKFELTQGRYNEKYADNPNAMIGDILRSFLHKLPYLLFLSLPFFALILKLLYARRKAFYYSDHAVFTLYHYIFSFILLLFYLLFDKLYTWLHWDFFNFLNVALFIFGGVYLFLSMKRFYGQKAGKTFLKFLLLNILGFWVLIFLFIGFLLFSVFQI